MSSSITNGLITGKNTRKKLKLLVELEIPFSILKDILIDGYFPVIVERRGILVVDRFKPTPGLVFDFSFWRRMYKLAPGMRSKRIGNLLSNMTFTKDKRTGKFAFILKN